MLIFNGMTKEKVKEIIKAYAVMINPNDIQSIIALERLAICDSCEFNKKKLGISKCSLCGCVIKAKVFTDKNSCPINKWKR